MASKNATLARVPILRGGVLSPCKAVFQAPTSYLPDVVEFRRGRLQDTDPLPAAATFISDAGTVSRWFGI